jgi:polar amino acid transport system permease protein
MTSLDGFLKTFLDPNIAGRYLPDLLLGAVTTIGLGITVVATGIGLGLILASVRSFGWRGINWPLIVCVDICRALPPLVIILIVYFGLPNVGIVLPSSIVLWLSLSAVLAAFSEEVFWAGITSVPPGQWMAARSTGLTRGQTLAFVVLPQAVRLAVPPLTNRTISVTKNLALGSAIGVNEILGRAMSDQAFSFNATPLTIGAFLYVIIFVPLVVGSRWLERQFAWRRA